MGKFKTFLSILLLFYATVTLVRLVLEVGHQFGIPELDVQIAILAVGAVVIGALRYRLYRRKLGGKK